jgi:hypothetical protein
MPYPLLRTEIFGCAFRLTIFRIFRTAMLSALLHCFLVLKSERTWLTLLQESFLEFIEKNIGTLNRRHGRSLVRECSRLGPYRHVVHRPAFGCEAGRYSYRWLLGCDFVVMTVIRGANQSARVGDRSGYIPCKPEFKTRFFSEIAAQKTGGHLVSEAYGNW